MVSGVKRALGRKSPVAVVLGVLACITWGQTEPAFAGRATCEFTRPILHIFIPAGRTARVRRDGHLMKMNGHPCARLADTRRVIIRGFGGTESLTYDLSGGHFVTSDQEIPFVVSLGLGTDPMVVKGSAGADFLVFGVLGLNVGKLAHSKVNVTLGGVDSLSVRARGGPDTVTGEGGFGTGAPFDHPSDINGGGGDDRLSDSLLATRVAGGPGSDFEIPSSERSRATSPGLAPCPAVQATTSSSASRAPPKATLLRTAPWPASGRPPGPAPTATTS